MVGVTIHGFSKVRATVLANRVAGHLGIPRTEGRILVPKRREEAVHEDQHLVPRAHRLGPPPVKGGVDDELCRDLGLVDGGNRLGVTIERGLTPVELGCIDGRKVDHAHVHMAPFVEELGTCRLEETSAGELRGTISRLERDPDKRQRRTHVHDIPLITRHHSRESCHRSPHLSEECNLDGPLEIGRRNLQQRRKDCRHGVVDPYVDWAQFIFDLAGRPVDFVEGCDVGGYDQCVTPGYFDVFGGSLKSHLSSGQEGYIETPVGELACGRSSDAGGRSGDDGNPARWWQDELLSLNRSAGSASGLAADQYYCTMHVSLNMAIPAPK